MKTFDNLKYVNIEFKDDIELRDSYERLIHIKSTDENSDVINELRNVYSIDGLELYLGNMFDQDVVDLINKHFIANEIISNSYLERDFLITFKFNEYITYINMFIDNNMDRLSMYDSDIVDYLRMFPSIIVDGSNPNIKLYTNYREV
jgi:predicted CopG family antitoxin